MAKLLLPYIPYTLNPKHKGELKFDAARRVIADKEMAAVHTMLDVNPTIVTERVRAWFLNHQEVHRHTDEVSWIDNKWYGRRLPQFSGVVAGYQFYYVRTPHYIQRRRHSNSL